MYHPHVETAYPPVLLSILVAQKSVDFDSRCLRQRPVPPHVDAEYPPALPSTLVAQKSMDFDSYGLNERLQRQLRKVGVDKFFPVQAQCFEKVQQ